MSVVFFIVIRVPPRSPLFPYTTLFRSDDVTVEKGVGVGASVMPAPAVSVKTGDGLGIVGAGEAELRRLKVCHGVRSEEHTSELQSPYDLVCRLLLEKKKASLRRLDGGI